MKSFQFDSGQTRILGESKGEHARLLLARQLETDILTISRGNSILVSRRPGCNFLWVLAYTFFVDITIKLYYSQKVIFQIKFLKK